VFEPKEDKGPSVQASPKNLGKPMKEVEGASEAGEFADLKGVSVSDYKEAKPLPKKDLTTCSVCGVKVRIDRLQKHIKKVHTLREVYKPVSRYESCLQHSVFTQEIVLHRFVHFIPKNNKIPPPFSRGQDQFT
jgi:hypothetical protein